MSTCNIEICGNQISGQEDILTPSALRFLAGLHQKFNHRRKVLLRYRSMQQARVEAGQLPEFPDKPGSVSHLPWTVTSPPKDLVDRRAEVSGSIDTRSIILGLNCGANVFVADFEDATSPTWENCIKGQINLKNAIEGNLWYVKKEGGMHQLKDSTTAIEVRPRALHCIEKHLLVNDEPISASLFDFGLYYFHNALPLLQKGSGPYFSLPKLENREEAKLWREIFEYSSKKFLRLPQETVKVSVCIETLPAVFEIEEIIFELRDYLTSLQAGRWNYLFSLIKNFRRYERYTLPDRDLIEMSLPFMEAYSSILVKLAHRRDAHAIGDMTLALPDSENESYEQILNEVREDSAMVARKGFDGTRVADHELVPILRDEFEKVMGNRPHQKDKQMEDITISRLDLLHTYLLDTGKVTEKLFRHNIDVLILYIASWLKGKGVIKFDKRLENAATAEVCRTQMWQWSHDPGVTLDDGRAVTRELCWQLLNEEKERILENFKNWGVNSEDFNKAVQLISNMVNEDKFEPYMTLVAYDLLE